MKKYVAPFAEMVILETKDIMIASGGVLDLDDASNRPTQGSKGWIDEFDSWADL